MDIVDLLAQMDERLAKMEEREVAARARHEALLAKMDTTLAKMDERLARQDDILAQLGVMIDHAREEATATRQLTAVALQRLTDTRLDVDQFIATAERVLAAWERDRP
jgi:hypothetical protein